MKTSKKVLSLLLAFAMLIIAIPISGINSFATDPSDFSYNVIDNVEKTAEITGYNGAGGDVVIPSEIDGYTIVSIGDFSFDGADSVTSLYISETIQNISSSALIGLQGCVEYTVSPQNNHYMSENGVVFNKMKTTLVKYPSSKLDSTYTVPDSVIEIGDAAFTYSVNLTNVILPNNLESISVYAFAYCIELTSISLPDSVSYLGEYAFAYCMALTEVELSDNIASIPDYAFSYSALSEITISSSVEIIGEGAFAGCSNLSGVVFNDSLQMIGSAAFAECSALSSLSLPDSLQSIEYGAFYSCASLESVTFGSGLQSIGNIAFYSCSSLTEITFLGSQTTIASDAFYNANVSVVYGFGNSYAETFATDNGYAFVDLSTLIPGDINNDSVFNVTDIDAALNIAVGITAPSSIQLYVGDANGDGVIDGFDVAEFDKKLNANADN